MAIIRLVRGNLYAFDTSTPPEPEPIETATSLFNKGWEAQNKGQQNEAMNYYRKALRINPHHSASHNNLANGLLNSWPQQWDEAMKHYRLALKGHPCNESAHFNIAVEYVRAGEKRKALHHFRLYLRYNGGDDYCWLGHALREVERLQAEDLQIVGKNTAAQQQTPEADPQTG